MGLTKQYLRYVADGVFNIIASPNCNVVFVSLHGQEGRFVAVGAGEDVIVWDLRLSEKVRTLLLHRKRKIMAHSQFWLVLMLFSAFLMNQVEWARIKSAGAELEV